MPRPPPLEMPILSLELLDLSLVAGVLLAHEGDVVGGLLEDLRAGALVSVVHAEMGEQNEGVFRNATRVICFRIRQ